MRTDRLTVLCRQRALVERELERLGATARALDATLAALQRGAQMEEAEMFKDFDPAGAGLRRPDGAR